MAERGGFGKIRSAIDRTVGGHTLPSGDLNSGQFTPEMLRGVLESEGRTPTSFARNITKVAGNLRAGRLGSETVLRTKGALLEMKTRLEGPDSALAAIVKLTPDGTVLYQTAVEGEFNYVNPRNARRRVGLIDRARGFFSDQVDRFPTQLAQVRGQMGTFYMGEDIGEEKGQLYLELTKWLDAPVGKYGYIGRPSRNDYLIPFSAIESITIKSQARQLPTFKDSVFNL